MSAKKKIRKYPLSTEAIYRDELVWLEMPRWQAEQCQKVLDALNKAVRDFWRQ